MAQPDQHQCEDGVVLKAVRDKTGWRVVLHLHQNNECATLEGNARFTTEAEAHQQGRFLHQVLDHVLGLEQPQPRQGGN